MKRKDMPDEMVVRAAMHPRDHGQDVADLLVEWTGRPWKVAFRAVERAWENGYVDWGANPRFAWPTPTGRGLVEDGDPGDVVERQVGGVTLRGPRSKVEQLEQVDGVIDEQREEIERRMTNRARRGSPSTVRCTTASPPGGESPVTEQRDRLMFNELDGTPHGVRSSHRAEFHPVW